MGGFELAFPRMCADLRPLTNVKQPMSHLSSVNLCVEIALELPYYLEDVHCGAFSCEPLANRSNQKLQTNTGLSDLRTSNGWQMLLA